MSIFKLEDGTCYFNVIIKDEKGQIKYDLSKIRLVDTQVEVLAFRMVYTAGIALPVYEIIMTSSVKQSLELFNQTNTIEIHYGSSPDKKDVFICDTVGHNIKKSPQEDIFVLNWGGVVKRGKLSASFLEAEQTGVYGASTSANPKTHAIVEAWKELAGTPLIAGDILEHAAIANAYKVPHQTSQNAINDMFLHIDLRPSFPLACIDKDGQLVIRDFQKIKEAGPVATFAPALHGVLGQRQRAVKIIPYVGNPTPVSFKPFVNRACGYTQINIKDAETGKYSTLATDVEGQVLKQGSKKRSSFFNKLFKRKNAGDSGVQKNKLASTQSNEARPGSHVKTTAQTKFTGAGVTKDYHAIELHNKNNLINMSAVQLQLRVEGTYLNDVHVLDIVDVQTGIRTDKISGYWLVEAIEQGFVDDHTSNIVYLCRDNFNDVENMAASTFSDVMADWLSISPDDKAEITTMVRGARKALTVCKSTLDRTYLQEFQAHLIGMKRSALANFNLFGPQININDAQSTVMSLKNNGAALANKAIRSFIKDPYATFFYNVILGDSNVMGLFMMILSTILGGELYGAFSELFADLRNFDLFLGNYNETLKYASQESQPNYAALIIAGVLTYQESPTGELVPIVLNTNSSTPMRATAMARNLTEDARIDLKDAIVAKISDNIPEEVDIPIPNIVLTDSEYLMSEEKLTDVIVDRILDDLISRGYVYDSDLIDNATTQSTIITASGKEISYDTAKATMLSSAKLKDMLLGKSNFDAGSVSKINAAIGSEIKIRHWGTFITYDDLTSFNINAGYVDKYKTVNATKVFSCNGGQRIYVALPASEVGTKFYINSIRSTEMEVNIMEVEDLGYYDTKGNPIPYIIYYTTEDFDTSSLTLEMRKN